MIKFKQIIYSIWHMLLNNIWRLSGGRRETVMGLALNLHPDTVWPGRRGLRLPKGDWRSKIVTFTDIVQAHAVCSAVTASHHPVIIIDVGAHHGAYAVLLGGLMKARQGGVLIAIEPDIANIKILRSNIERNNLQNIVQVVEGAVSDFTGEMDFVSSGSESYLLAEDNAEKHLAYKVKVETLRDILAKFQLNKVDFLLIDVEGAELPVLMGFPWETMQPTMIFCELHPYNWPMFGYSGQDFSNFLKEHQYRCLDMFLHEHSRFDGSNYVGPCLFLSQESSSNVEV
jgi:FkbM family methyltransferase